MMSERDTPAFADGGPEKAAKPNLMERLRSLFGLGGASIRDDIQDALEGDPTDADFSPLERAMLKNVLALHEVRVEDLMVPRADIVAVPSTIKLYDLVATFREAGHSRLAVHADTLDDPRGMVHIRDLVDYIATAAFAVTQPAGKATAEKPLDMTVTLAEADILRPVLFVPPSMPALDLLVKMQTTRTHMALVIDEYGGTDGLASIEDIVEMIVGDIEDEHDYDDGPKIEAVGAGEFVADARASLEDVGQAIGADLTRFSDAEDVDTLGGLVTALAGQVPLRGEILSAAEFEFEVLDADPRRVKRIKIRSGGKPAASPEAPETGKPIVDINVLGPIGARDLGHQ